MAGKILALLENSIGPQLLLSTRLEALGYRVTVLSTPDGFMRRIREETFEWVVLDEGAARPGGGRLLKALARRKDPTPVVWLGRPRRRGQAGIVAVFRKPLNYNEIGRFFSRQASRGLVRTHGPSRGNEARPSAGADPAGASSAAARWGPCCVGGAGTAENAEGGER